MFEKAEPKDPISDRFGLEFYNARSRVKYLPDTNQTVFVFDYFERGGSNQNDDGPEQQLQPTEIDWRVLKQLKEKKKWAVLRHPMLLNYVNQKLLDCALIYTLHIAAFAFFLLFLSSHIFYKTAWKDWVVTAFVALFSIMMFVKGTVKARVEENRISFWFLVSYVFNILTYIATFLYVWFPTLSGYDDYHLEKKEIIAWFLPIVAIISAWINFLYILRKSPFGIYIFMMVRILKSFGHIATIWIPTLIAFSFAFHLIMRDTGTEPWQNVRSDTNGTILEGLFVVLQALTKTSTMMIGEVDANDILSTKQWIPSVLVLVFEIITVILLMNLMISLAVGDVSDLRSSAQDKLLKIKVNFVIEALQMSQLFQIPYVSPLYKKPIDNVLVIEEDGKYHTIEADLDLGEGSSGNANDDNTNVGKTFQIVFPTTGMKMRTTPLEGKFQTAILGKCSVNLLEMVGSGIPEFKNTLPKLEGEMSYLQRYKSWVIGLDWSGYLDL